MNPKVVFDRGEFIVIANPVHLVAELTVNTFLASLTFASAVRICNN